MNEKIGIDVKSLGYGKKRLTIKTENLRWSFRLDKEYCMKWARIFEEAADDLMSWDGAE